MEELRSGDIIRDRYSLVRCLGNGSFGEVWLAHDVLTGREVALKIYLTLDPNGIKEFNREYSTTIDLASPYLLTPKYFDVHGRRPFLVMKYCQNGSAAKLAGKISEQQLWQFVHDVARGLEALHNQANPIVHQDIKPDNVLIDENGRFLITDFGISTRLRATMRKQSRRDVHSGAIPYMAPERFDATPRLSTASDIWSLGASIYELATGLLPFNGMGGKMLEHGAEIPSLLSNYSPRLNELMQKCLSPNEKDRPSVKKLRMMTAREKPKAPAKPVSLTDVKLYDPNKVVKLNIRGKVTDCCISPDMEEVVPSFAWTLITLILFVLFVFFTAIPFKEVLREAVVNYNFRPIIATITAFGPFIMYFAGYSMLKDWNPLGKKLLCGSCYPLALLWLLSGIIGSKETIVNDFVPLYTDNAPWFSWILPCVFFLGNILASLALIFLYLYTPKCLKREYSGKNSTLWHYRGKRIWPIIMEYVLPAILVISFIILYFI